MNKRQAKKKQRNIDKWWGDFAGATYDYRNNRIMNRKYHEFCVKQRHFINRDMETKLLRNATLGGYLKPKLLRSEEDLMERTFISETDIEKIGSKFCYLVNCPGCEFAGDCNGTVKECMNLWSSWLRNFNVPK